MGDPRLLLEAIGVLRGELKGFEPSCYSPADCTWLAEELARVEKACAAARLLAGARAVACDAHRKAGVADPARWVARQAGTTRRQARDALATAASLEGCRATRDALLAGEVSILQAAEITKAVAELPGEEVALLEAAKAGDLTTLRDEARERRLASIPVTALHRRQVASRRFRHWHDGLGMVCFDGALPPETGIPFITRVERLAQRLWRGAKHDGAQEPFQRHAADALCAISGGGAAATSPPRTELVIVCDLHAWRRGHAHPGEPCHLIGGSPIPVALAKELSHDAFLKAVLHDGVDIQRICHIGRKYTAHLRTALDLGPVPDFTGKACAECKSTVGLERDHEVPVARTGRSSISNVVSRCHRCHAEKTERDRLAGLLGRKARARAPGPQTQRAKKPASRPLPARRAPPPGGWP
jgi:hypothetical protein